MEKGKKGVELSDDSRPMSGFKENLLSESRSANHFQTHTLVASTMGRFRLAILSILLLATPSACETEDAEVVATIVGGQDASPEEYLFMAQWSGCGATLIWKDMLLTAAHVSQTC